MAKEFLQSSETKPFPSQLLATGAEIWNKSNLSFVENQIHAPRAASVQNTLLGFKPVVPLLACISEFLQFAAVPGVIEIAFDGASIWTVNENFNEARFRSCEAWNSLSFSGLSANRKIS